MSALDRRESLDRQRSTDMFRTWLNDTALAALTVGLARRQEHDRLLPRKTQDDWREWIYVFILDHMSVDVEHFP